MTGSRAVPLLPTQPLRPRPRSLRGRLLVLWAISLVSAVAVGTLLVQLYRQSSIDRVARADAVAARGCDGIADRYRFWATGWTGPVDAAVRDGLSAVVAVALIPLPGVEGGIWQREAGPLAYAYPTYDGTGPKTDLPAAELDRIRAINADALDADRAVALRQAGRSQTLLLHACPLPGPIEGATAWTMTRVFTSGSAGLTRLALAQASRPVLVFLDLRMPGLDGMEVLRRLRATAAAPPVVVLTAYASGANTIEAMRQGAFDHLTKPLGRADIADVLARALRPAIPPAPAAAPIEDGPLVGASPAIRAVQKLIGMAAASDATVLVTGETGTGKELAARALHEHGPRAGRPFVSVNCAAIPAELLESELFGHVAGAFTGAVRAQPGRFREAAGGTLLAQLAAAVKVGDAVTVRGLRAAAVPMVAAMAVTDDASGQTVVDNGPEGRRPGPGRGPDHGPGAPPAAIGEVSGKVLIALHGPRGELNGAMLEDGTALRLPPPEAARLSAMLQPGQAVVAQGPAVTSTLGRVVMVRGIGATRDALQQVQAPPPHGPRPDRRGPDAAPAPSL